jgi:hypothetical protein
MSGRTERELAGRKAVPDTGCSETATVMIGRETQNLDGRVLYYGQDKIVSGRTCCRESCSRHWLQPAVIGRETQNLDDRV